MLIYNIFNFLRLFVAMEVIRETLGVYFTY